MDIKKEITDTGNSFKKGERGVRDEKLPIGYKAIWLMGTRKAQSPPLYNITM